MRCNAGPGNGLHLGIGVLKKDMAVLMTLNNGQAITLSNAQGQGAVDGASPSKLWRKRRRNS